MAKRTTSRSQSQVDDGAGAAAAPRARARRASAAGREPSEEDIRLRAYHRFLERGSSHGLDFDDWVEAERELRIKK